MWSFDDIKELEQPKKWKKKFNQIYGVNLDEEDIHRLFEKFGINFKTSVQGGVNIRFYDKQQVIGLINSGRLKREIETIMRNRKVFSGLRKLPVSYSNPPDESSEKVVKRGRRNIILPNKPIETTNDDLDVEYRNGENDMEKYSEYLINNVYQFESKGNNIRNIGKGVIKESKLRQIIKEAIKHVLNEEEWNYHYGKNHDGSPYVSDNKYNMMGRDTGHFGSGTYFSTYKDKGYNNPNDKYSDNSTPEFIQIDNNLYRVDIDLYKNLYRVYNTKHGQVLFALLKSLNGMYYNVKYGNFNNSEAYQVALRNADALRLKIPSYNKLIRMMQEHEKSDKKQSFSTIFMEYNGYNGVNVSNVPGFDNTTHGSVIYNLSDTIGKIEQIPPRAMYDSKGVGNNIVIPNSTFDDIVVNSMYDELRYEDIEKINMMPLNQAMRILKNNLNGNKLISIYYLGKLNEELLKHFLYYVYHNSDKYSKLIDYTWLYRYRDEEQFCKIIENTKSYYWIKYDEGIFEYLVNNFVYDLPYNMSKDEQISKIEKYVNIILDNEKPSNKMQEFINDIIENIN